MSTDILSLIEAKEQTWMQWLIFWNVLGYVVGGASIVFGTLVALNLKTEFLSKKAALVLAILAPLASFTLTSLKPNTEATGFRLAGRELEKAVVKFKADPKKDANILVEAHERGVNLLTKGGD